MPRSARLLNALAAVCAILMVAAVLAAFARTPASRTTTVRASGTSWPGSTRATTTTAAPATTSTPTTAAPATTTATAKATVPTTSVATTAAPRPVIDANHRVAVGTASFTFVDASRPTPPAGGDPGTADRTLPTIVRYPVDGPAGTAERPGATGSRAGAPFPVIVFAEGFQTTSGQYASLLDSWASAGYVVAAPAFPRATAGGPLDEGDLANQPGDLSFVMTKMVALTAPGGPLAGLVDTAHIGVAGHSDGASTTEGIGYNSCCRDRRVLADSVMEGDEHSFGNGAFSPAGAPPLLVIQGDKDAFNPAQYGLQLYQDAHAPKYLLSLLNAQHLEPFTTDMSHLAVVEAVTTSFFDRYLKGRADGVSGMQRGASPGLSTLTVG